MEKIQKYPPSFQDRFLINQKIDQRRTSENPAGVKGPLIPLQKGQILHLPGIFKIVHQKFPLTLPLPVGGNETRKHLHIGSAHIPAGLQGSHSKLPFCQILSFYTGLEGDSAAAKLRGRIDTVMVHTGRTAGCKHHIFTPDKHEFTAVRYAFIQAERSMHLFILYQKLDQLHMIQNRDLPLSGLPLQTFRHDFGGIGAHAGSPSSPVVIRLIADVFPIFIIRKGNPQLRQIVKASCGQSRLAQGQIPIHTLAPEKILRHAADTVRFLSGQGQLIVGLLVGPCIA